MLCLDFKQVFLYFYFSFPALVSISLVECKVEMKHCASIMPWDPLFLLSETLHREKVDFTLFTLAVKISFVAE